MRILISLIVCMFFIFVYLNNNVWTYNVNVEELGQAFDLKLFDSALTFVFGWMTYVIIYPNKWGD